MKDPLDSSQLENIAPTPSPRIFISLFGITRSTFDSMQKMADGMIPLLKKLGLSVELTQNLYSRQNDTQSIDATMSLHICSKKSKR